MTKHGWQRTVPMIFLSDELKRYTAAGEPLQGAVGELTDDAQVPRLRGGGGW